jgi:hypothetical protein
MPRATASIRSGQLWAVLLAAVLAWGTLDVAAQDRQRRPNPLSPRTTATGTIDGQTITVEDGAPSRRGREIFGAHVPWDRVWMPGADTSTSLTTTAALLFEGSDGRTLELPAGTCTIYTLPGAARFLLILNREVGQFHTVYHPEQDLGRLEMRQVPTGETVERLTFAVDPGPDGGGELKLIWDDRAYVVGFTVRAAVE